MSPIIGSSQANFFSLPDPLIGEIYAFLLQHIPTLVTHKRICKRFKQVISTYFGTAIKNYSSLILKQKSDRLRIASIDKALTVKHIKRTTFATNAAQSKKIVKDWFHTRFIDVINNQCLIGLACASFTKKFRIVLHTSAKKPQLIAKVTNLSLKYLAFLDPTRLILLTHSYPERAYSLSICPLSTFHTPLLTVSIPDSPFPPLAETEAVHYWDDTLKTAWVIYSANTSILSRSIDLTHPVTYSFDVKNRIDTLTLFAAASQPFLGVLHSYHSFSTYELPHLKPLHQIAMNITSLFKEIALGPYQVFGTSSEARGKGIYVWNLQNSEKNTVEVLPVSEKEIIHIQAFQNLLCAYTSRGIYFYDLLNLKFIHATQVKTPILCLKVTEGKITWLNEKQKIKQIFY